MLKKQTSLILAILCFAFVCTQAMQRKKTEQMDFNNYANLWEKVSVLEKEGKTKSALEEVEQIFSIAKRESNTPQIAKAMLFKGKYSMTIQENSELKFVQELKGEINRSIGIEKAILQSILARSYWMYYQNHRYKFLERTHTTNDKNEDFRTWDPKTLFTEIANQYMASLKEAELLQKTSIDAYSEILNNLSEASKNLRPTLYDLLAHEALSFFSNTESGLSEAISVFELNDDRYFSEAVEFSNLSIQEPESITNDFLATKLYQELLKFRSKQNNKAAFVDVDLSRLKFVKNHFKASNKNELYIKSLETLANSLEENPATAEVNFDLAKALNNSNQSNEDLSIKKRVVELCNETIDKYPQTVGAKNCAVLKQQLLQQALNVTTEQVEIPNQPFKALVSYTNIDKIYCKVVPLNYNDDKLLFSKKQEEIIRALNRRGSARSWQVKLPSSNDYNNHTIEIDIEKLGKGYYALLFSPNADFSIQNSAVALNVVWLSNIGYTTRKKNGQLEVQVMGRKEGLPMADAHIQTYRRVYDYKSRKYNYVKGKSFTTNEKGYAKITGVDQSQNFQLEIKHKEDFLGLEHSFYIHNFRERTPKKNVSTHFFTDRAIYRPGQTIYFKGLIVESFDGENRILSDKKTTVVLRDVNYKEVSKLSLTTNEYGTFSGSFTAPSNTLMGNFTIRNEQGQKSIRIEEYKRPSFEVAFLPITKSYNLEDVVTVKGNTKTYSGANLSNAKVSYKVVRNVIRPYYFHYWRRPSLPYSNSKEITFGETETDEQGNFEIDFKAIPDKAISQDQQAYFTYEVIADVTDISGETRSNSATVKIGYISLLLNCDVKEYLDRDKNHQINISTTNLNGEFEAAEVEVKIYELEGPKIFKKKRYWETPEFYTLNKNDHDKLFPNSMFKEEENPLEWPKKKAVFSKSFNTLKKKEMALSPTNFSNSGKYLIEIKAKDKKGQLVLFKKVITFTSTNDQHPISITPLIVKTPEEINKGEILNIVVGSSFNNAKAIVEVSNDGNILKREIIALNNSFQTISAEINNTLRENIEVKAFLIKYNRQFSKHSKVTIPSIKKELNVEWLSFRDKLLPGQKEEWQLKITGPYGEKISAELLATMYDASLDAFASNQFYFHLPKKHISSLQSWNNVGFGRSNGRLYSIDWHEYKSYIQNSYHSLNFFGFYMADYGIRNFAFKSRASNGRAENIALMDAAAAPMEMVEAEAAGFADADESATENKEEATRDVKKAEKEVKKEEGSLVPRSNFDETAFFFPDLKTDKEGNTIFSFKMPEALTKWKFLGFAHTKELNHKIFSKEVVTQKELMVIPNVPRFLREKDNIVLTTKIINLSNKKLEGTSTIKLYDVLSGKEITTQLLSNGNNVAFSVDPEQNTLAQWEVKVPYNIQAIKYEIIANAGGFTDGETNTLPVLSNRMLVTETLPLNVLGGENKDYTFEKLANYSSKTLKHHQLTLEISSNPIWYAVQALPYLMEYPYECAEQTFNRYYANTLASYIANSNSRIKAVFDQWKNAPDSKALLSNLEKNQELKMLLIEETPWLREAQNESEQKKRIALLFDLNKMAYEQKQSLDKLFNIQTPNGGFSWFPGMRDNRYITQYIVSGFGHLKQLKVAPFEKNERSTQVLNKAIKYLDQRILEDYQEIKKHNKKYLTTDNLGSTQIQYLYARSFFNHIDLNRQQQIAFDYFLEQSKEHWLNKSYYMQGMISIALGRYNEKEIPSKIITALKENAISHEERGMYWKEVEQGGYYWYNAPIETQALLIEAFEEIGGRAKDVDNLKLWLLKQKQVQRWTTTKATADACYALLLGGSNWIEDNQSIEVKIDKKTVNPIDFDSNIEAGTGHFKIKWNGREIDKPKANISLSNPNKGPAWGAMYWQYFEDLDKITSHQTPLNSTKEVYKEINTSEGKKLVRIGESDKIEPGDLLKIRVILKSDRNMEFVHMKDMRASGLEPINVLSSYKWQDGLGYYESTRDAATHFFFDYLPKGVYVFEYPLRVTHSGNFSNGITSIQCMYAPEFASHSKGIRLNIE